MSAPALTIHAHHTMTDTAKRTSQHKFAFGRDKVGHYCCPALAAGKKKKNTHRGDLGAVTRRYDRRARQLTGDSEGTVEASVAEQAWTEAIEELEEGGNHTAYKVGEKIADELGWLDND